MCGVEYDVKIGENSMSSEVDRGNQGIALSECNEAKGFGWDSRPIRILSRKKIQAEGGRFVEQRKDESNTRAEER